jgi:hypothetical protein
MSEQTVRPFFFLGAEMTTETVGFEMKNAALLTTLPSSPAALSAMNGFRPVALRPSLSESLPFGSFRTLSVIAYENLSFF